MEKKITHFPRYELNDRVAVVTGGGHGLGRWIALGLAEAGASILIASRNAEKGEKTIKEIEQLGKKAFFFQTDVGDIQNVKAMMEFVCTEMGELDILINNAGVNVHKKALDVTAEEFDYIVRVNSKGVYFCSQAAAKVMIPRKRGKIINIASSAAFLVRAGVPNSIYAMTKAGIVMLTKALAEEWAQYNINVNTLAPGYFNTPLVADRLDDSDSYNKIMNSTPLKRIGGPEDIIGGIVFLASDASNFITGQTICVDGGRTIL